MSGEAAKPANESANRPRRATVRSESAPIIDGLERIRDSLLLKLDAIDAIIQEQLEFQCLNGSEREQILRERVVALEAAVSRHQAETRRREQDWAEKERELEADQLAIREAWERLEAQQIAGPSVQGLRPDESSERTKTESPTYVSPTADLSDDPMIRVIRKQFQAMQDDVRRTSRGRGSR